MGSAEITTLQEWWQRELGESAKALLRRIDQDSLEIIAKWKGGVIVTEDDGYPD